MFSLYERFVNEMLEFVPIRTIVVSSANLSFNYFKIYLPYPDLAKLKEIVEETLD